MIWPVENCEGRSRERQWTRERTSERQWTRERTSELECPRRGEASPRGSCTAPPSSNISANSEQANINGEAKPSLSLRSFLFQRKRLTLIKLFQSFWGLRGRSPLIIKKRRGPKARPILEFCFFFKRSGGWGGEAPS